MFTYDERDKPRFIGKHPHMTRSSKHPTSTVHDRTAATKRDTTPHKIEQNRTESNKPAH